MDPGFTTNTCCDLDKAMSRQMFKAEVRVSMASMILGRDLWETMVVNTDLRDNRWVSQ
jgi:hypothetical protein